VDLIAPIDASARGMHDLCLEICTGMWSVTPYARCDFRCRYCCTSVQGDSEPIAGVRRDGDVVAALRSVPGDDLLILGAFSDAYPSVESELGATRRVLETMATLGRRVTIVTKGDTVLRDLDLLHRLGDRALVQISVCTTDDDVLRQIDPGAPSGTRRFEVLGELHAAGVAVELNALPWIPGVSDTAALLARLPDGVGANFAPLATGGEEMHLLRRRFRRVDIWEAYLDEYRRFGHLEQTSWIRPSLPPAENHPLSRLPRLPAPTAAPKR
jgi:DNA repair photolyase